MTLQATFHGAALTAESVDPAGRTINGVAVPWNQIGTVSSGERVKFLPGSLDPASRPPVLRDHDRQRPLGRVTGATDTGAQMLASIRVSKVPDGDTALVLAADGALGALSVGADPTEYHYDDAGVLVVAAADWLELSLLTFGAFPDALVTDVTASQHQGVPAMTATATPALYVPPIAASSPEPDPAPDDPTPDIDDDPTPDIDDPPAPTVQAAALTPRRPTSSRSEPEMTVRQVAHLIAAAAAGQIPKSRAIRQIHAAAEQDAQFVAAALANVTLVGANNVGVAQRPAYQPELIELINWDRPVVEALRRGTLERGDYPNKTFNRWNAAPTVGLQAAEKDEITSTAVSIVAASCPVLTWAGGNDISQQILDFGSPSFVEDYIRAAAVDYARKSDTYAVTTLLAAATDTPPGADFVANVGVLLGQLNPATVPPGQLWLAVSYDVGTGLVGMTRDQGPAFWDGNISFGKFLPTAEMGGLSVFVDPNMPVKTYLMGMQNGATWYEQPGTPASLRINDVHLLGLDVAVFGYGALGIQYAGAFAKMTTL